MISNKKSVYEYIKLVNIICHSLYNKKYINNKILKIIKILKIYIKIHYLIDKYNLN